MLRQPPRSPRFPNTTLFRSHCAAMPAEAIRPAVEKALLTAWADAVVGDDARLHPAGGLERDRLVEEFRRLDRSEEHTSELQSRQILVCRILLAKNDKT